MPVRSVLLLCWRDTGHPQGGGSETYRYWLEEKNGKLVNGGWDPSSSSPDFLWRPQTEAAFTGRNERNPFVDPKLVKDWEQDGLDTITLSYTMYPARQPDAPRVGSGAALAPGRS